MRLRKFKTHEILSRSIGIGLYNGMVNFLIPRNTQLPFGSEFTLNKEANSFDLYEGERPHVKYCKYIGKLKFERETSGKQANNSWRVLITIDNEGIMKVKHLRENATSVETVISFEENNRMQSCCRLT
jgi:molecular chaperone DnaK (HSP70)